MVADEPSVAGPTPTPHRRPEDIAPDPVPKERKPLNPAYAILAGACLTAVTGITATLLTIRSSERLTRERDLTDLARSERDQLQKELDKVKVELATQSSKISEFSATTLAPATTAALSVPPSIVVVLPPQLVAPTPAPPDRSPTTATTAPQLTVPNSTTFTASPTIPATTSPTPTQPTTSTVAATTALAVPSSVLASSTAAPSASTTRAP